jgi:hypothetical protein
VSALETAAWLFIVAVWMVLVWRLFRRLGGKEQ